MIDDQLRQAIRASCESHNELARLSGVSQPSISRFVAGMRGLNLLSAAALAKALGITLAREESDP